MAYNSIMEELRLFSYKMTHDTGFAPNPFHGFLTLANCKPCIRKCKNKSDWIAGFSSSQLNNDKVGEERLVYLMKVTNKITYDEYWNNNEYECKKPKLESKHIFEKAGDNIYKPVSLNKKTFEQINNKFHDESQKEHDLSGNFVLVSNHFYYFGGSPIQIPLEVRPDIPKGQSSNGNLTHDSEIKKKFIHYIESNYTKGLINMPDGMKSEINPAKVNKCV
jgi:hypothetical protein